MAILDILEFPDPRLRTKAQPVKTVDARIRTFISDMLETMYAAPGIGLAATQVNEHIRVVVIDVSEQHDQPLVLVNPQYTVLEGTQTYDEGCLSVPGYYETVTRAERIRVNALDREGKSQDFEADGLLSVCIQHELDHLDGKLFVDHISSLKRQRIRKKLEKEQRSR